MSDVISIMTPVFFGFFLGVLHIRVFTTLWLAYTWRTYPGTAEEIFAGKWSEILPRFLPATVVMYLCAVG